MTDDLTPLGLVDEEEIILDEAALALAAVDHPAVEAAPYREVLAEIAARLTVEGANAIPASARAEALSAVLADEFGFEGDAVTYDDPANADLMRVIDRRRGLPVSLSILYVSAARRLGWQAAALNVPGHVLVLVGDEVAPIVIDPFRRGRIVTPDQWGAILGADHSGRAVHHVDAMSNRAVLVRLLLNQATRAEATGQGRRALTLYRRMTLVAPSYPQGWWEVARLELVDGDVDAARRSLGTILEITREPALRQRVSELLGRLSDA